MRFRYILKWSLYYNKTMILFYFCYCYLFFQNNLLFQSQRSLTTPSITTCLCFVKSDHTFKNSILCYAMYYPFHTNKSTLKGCLSLCIYNDAIKQKQTKTTCRTSPFFHVTLNLVDIWISSQPYVYIKHLIKNEYNSYLKFNSGV